MLVQNILCLHSLQEKEFMVDLERVYKAPTKETAKDALLEL